jgi:hypothetical protein
VGLNVAGLANAPLMPLTLMRPVEVLETVASPLWPTERVPAATLNPGPIVTDCLPPARKTETLPPESPMVVLWK